MKCLNFTVAPVAYGTMQEDRRALAHRNSDYLHLSAAPARGAPHDCAIRG